MSKKVLIIGGAGFIGRNIAKHLVKKEGYSITIADNFFRGKRDKEINDLENNYGVRIISKDFNSIFIVSFTFFEIICRFSFSKIGNLNFFKLPSPKKGFIVSVAKAFT